MYHSHKEGLGSSEHWRPRGLFRLFTIYTKKSGNFGWNVNGKIDFVPPNGNFLGKTEFPNGKCAFHLLIFLAVPGLLAWIAFDPTLQEKDVVMERAHPRGNFYSGFDASHLPQLSTNRFLRVNGKQP